MSERALPVLLATAPALALGAGLMLAFGPVYADGASLVEVEGTWTMLLLAVIVGVTAVPLRSPARLQGALAVAIGVVIVLFSFISVIGVWYLPAAAALLIAGWMAPGEGSSHRR